MKKIVRLTESDLSRIVNRVIKEDIQNNELYKRISDVLWNSNDSNEEQIAVLKHILNQKEGRGFVTKEKVNPDLSGLEKLVQRVMRKGIDEEENEEDIPDYIQVYHMYKNGEVSKRDFYGYMGVLEKHERQDLIDYIKDNNI